MKILNKILIGSLSLLCLSSCDFLDETAYNKEEFYKLKYCSTVVYMVPRA